jgi:hypothetical protein
VRVASVSLPQENNGVVYERILTKFSCKISARYYVTVSCLWVIAEKQWEPREEYTASIFNSEDGGIIFLRNARTHLTNAYDVET